MTTEFVPGQSAAYGDFEKVGVALIHLAGYAKEKQAVLAKNGDRGRAPGLKERLRAPNCSFEYAAHERYLICEPETSLTQGIGLLKLR